MSFPTTVGRRFFCRPIFAIGLVVTTLFISSRPPLSGLILALSGSIGGAMELGLLSLGMVSIDGSKIDANASKIKSVRYDRATALREKLAADIAALTAEAAADASDLADTQALPAEIARREVLKARLDARSRGWHVILGLGSRHFHGRRDGCPVARNLPDPATG